MGRKIGWMEAMKEGITGGRRKEREEVKKTRGKKGRKEGR